MDKTTSKTRFGASEFAHLFAPSYCELRPWLVEHGGKPKGPSAFDQVLFKMGQQYEADHLGIFKDYVDISGGGITLWNYTYTFEAMEDPKTTVIYQPVFAAKVSVDDFEFELNGRPDFLIRIDGGWKIRDVKLASGVSQKEKPEIWIQLQAYAYLFNRYFDEPLKGLEIYNGKGELIEVEYAGEDVFIDQLTQYLRLIRKDSSEYEPVGVSKCQGCGFKDKCWKEAEKNEDVALVYGVSTSIARSLHQRGIETISALANVDETALSEITHENSNGPRKIGKVASKIVAMAQSLKSSQPIIHSKPILPDCGKGVIVFDIEGIPGIGRTKERQYLWGFQVYGKAVGEYKGCLAGFDENGDREGWENFLEAAGKVFEKHGDLPWIHYHHYETTQVKKYIKRYGDKDEIGERVLRNLFDLLPVLRSSVSLPLPSYSLKVVEKYVGFKRKLADYKGDDSMASFVEAVECGEGKDRDDIMKQVLLYNDEDLQSTWAVFQWARNLSG